MSIAAVVIRSTGSAVTLIDVSGREVEGFAAIRQHTNFYGENDEGAELVTEAKIALSAMHPDEFDSLIVPAGQLHAGLWKRSKLIDSDSGVFVCAVVQVQS